jgi:uncharacterized alkaline shock family protein YloU
VANNDQEETPQEDTRAPGVTTIAPNVLVRIAQLTALTISGVAGMASVPGGVNRLFRKGSGEGVRIEVENSTVAADLYLRMAQGVDVRAVSREVQQEVARAFEDMVGMAVQRVDVHIEEISFD